MNSKRNIRAIKFVIYGIMFTRVSRMILIFAYVLISLTILMILKALTTVAAVEKLDPEVVKLSTIPMSVPITTMKSKRFHAE